MKYEIENKISKSPIKTIDLDDFTLGINITVFDIKNWLKEQLPAYKIPKRFIIQEDLPRNVMGKVTKMELKKIFLTQNNN